MVLAKTDPAGGVTKKGPKMAGFMRHPFVLQFQELPVCLISNFSIL